LLALIFLFAAHAFFLWMFMAAEGLERMADAGRISGSPEVDVSALAYQFAAEWRHGMAGGWPLYVPGFFVAAIATWLWSGSRTLRRQLAEGIGIMSLATATAMLVASVGARRIVVAFEHESGLRCEGVPPGPSAVGIVLGLYTLLAWSTVIVGSQRAIATRSVRPLGVPIALNALLFFLRPFSDLSGLTTLWGERVLQGNGIAIASLLAIPGAVTFMGWHQVLSERRSRRIREAGL
jgi:hypothetical protein